MEMSVLRSLLIRVAQSRLFCYGVGEAHQRETDSPAQIHHAAMPRTAHRWKFRPHPLLPNGHLQSFAGIYLPRRDAPYQAIQHQVPLDDGDHLVLHEDQPEGAGDEPPIVLLIHGLGGCYLSTYMRRMTERLLARGYHVFRMDMRGCGAGQGLAKHPTHCGRSGDVAATLHYIANLYSQAATHLVGFSMGGTLALNMLAESGEIRVGNLRRTLAICPPIDLMATERGFHTRMGRRYDRFFVRLLWKQIVDRWQRFPEMAPIPIPQRPRRLRDIDELVIAPSAGFTSAEDYYRQTAPGPKLKSIQQPVTILVSQDDPIIPFAPLGAYPRSSSVETIATSHGGHLGFLSLRGDDPDLRWLDWRIIDWLEEGRGKAEGGRRRAEEGRGKAGGGRRKRRQSQTV